MIKDNNIKLGEVAEFRNGVNYNESNFGTGIKIINVANFKDYSKPNYEELSEINPNELIKEDDLLQNGDIVFVRSNGNKNLIGRSLYIDEIEDGLTYSAFCIRARFTSKECNPRFYAYLFKTNLIRKTLSSQGNGTNISNLNQKILNNLVVPKPSIDKQNKIVSLLSRYDDLIENNIKRIKLLEESAELIYKEWFVNLRFPGYEKCNIVDGVPEGWNNENLGNLIKIIKGKKPKDIIDYKTEDSIPYLLVETLERKCMNYTNDKNIPLADKNELLMIMDGSRSGNIYRSTGGAIGSTLSLFKIVKNNICNEYLYYFIKYRQNEIKQNNTGSAIPHANKNYINSMEIIIPNEVILYKFTNIILNIHDKIDNLYDQNEKLKEARDILIPRLISDEIEV